MEAQDNQPPEQIVEAQVTTQADETIPEAAQQQQDAAAAAAAASAEGQPEATAQEWKPNYKVKSYDKEYEIPEKFRQFITKDNERDFRDAFEQVFAMQEMKAKNQKIRAENDNFRQAIEKEYIPAVKTIKQMERYLANDDFDSFFANIPAFKGPEGEQRLQLWMLRKLQEKELPPEQQALYNDARAAKQRAYQLEDENNSYKEKFENLSQERQQAAINETLDRLDAVVASPQVAEIAKGFDSRLGQDGSYKMEVLRTAANLATQLKRDVSIEEAVEHFNKMIGVTPAQNAAPQSAPQPKAPEPKPTLPSLNGKATSPATQKIKSIDDLKKLRTQMIAAESRRSRE